MNRSNHLFATSILGGFIAMIPGWAQSSKPALAATPPSLGPGETAQFQVSGTSQKITNLEPDPSAGLKCAQDNSTKNWACTAPDAPGEGLAVTGTVLVKATLDDQSVLTTTVELVGQFDISKRGPWEARAIAGYHQAGAASADFSQNVIIDIYVVRPLSRKDKVWEARLNSWGNVRIASAPQQINAPFIEILQGLVAPETNPNAPSPLNTPVNQLALSAEFETGLEYNFTPAWNGKMLGLIGFFGATGSFQSPDQSVHLYYAPTPDSPQYPLFKERFPTVNSKYVGFVNPDRDRFYRQWGLGFRYSKFHTTAYESPQTFSFTLGQDELITGGRFQSVVARFDGFYPLPVGTRDGKWNFLYLFGTTSLRLSRGDNRQPLVLQPAPITGNGAVHPYDNTVTIVASGSNRDTYRIGIGADLVNLMRSAFQKH